MSTLKDRAKFLIGWPLSLLAIIFIGKFVLHRWDQVSTRTSEINLSFIFVSALLFALYYFLRSILWKKLFHFLGHEVNYLDNSYKFAMSELKRFVPGNIWSFLTRGVLFHGMGIPKTAIAKALLFEIQLIIVGCAIASIPAIPYLLNSSADFKNKVISLIPISILAIIIFFVVISYLFKKKYNSLRSEAGEQGSLLERVYLPGLKFNEKIILTLLSVVLFFVFGLANFFVFLSVFPNHLNLAIQLSSFFTFALLVGYLSFITPMGLGVREGVVTLGLLKIVSIVDSSFFAIFSRVILIVSELVYLFTIFMLFKLVKRNS